MFEKAVVEEMSITSSTYHIMGDKGNTHYSAELDKTITESLEVPVVEETMTSSTGAVTGDKGNVHYSRELDQMIDSLTALGETLAQS